MLEMWKNLFIYLFMCESGSAFMLVGATHHVTVGVVEAEYTSEVSFKGLAFPTSYLRFCVCILTGVILKQSWLVVPYMRHRITSLHHP